MPGRGGRGRRLPGGGAQTERVVDQDEVDPAATDLQGLLVPTVHGHPAPQWDVHDGVPGAGGEGEERGEPRQTFVVAEQPGEAGRVGERDVPQRMSRLHHPVLPWPD